MPLPKITTDDFHAIESHNELLISAAQTALDDLKALPSEQRNANVVGRIRYWKSVKSALNWSTGIARQRIKGRRNGNWAAL